jgi:probable rRNA maturation factor
MASHSAKVNLHFLVTSIHLPHRRGLKALIEQIFKDENKLLIQLDYIFCSDSYLLKINQDYLGHDFYTDVITFDLSEDGKIYGEIYISVDRIRENAPQFGVTLLSETHRVMFHGALHLTGYTDKTKAGRQTMRQRENHYLNKIRD